MKEATSEHVNATQKDSLNLTWRDTRYHRFYEVVDQLVHELQEHVWVKTGKPKRRLKGDGLEGMQIYLMAKASINTFSSADTSPSASAILVKKSFNSFIASSLKTSFANLLK